MSDSRVAFCKLQKTRKREGTNVRGPSHLTASFLYEFLPECNLCFSYSCAILFVFKFLLIKLQSMNTECILSIAI